MKKYQKVDTPCGVSFYSHIADIAGCGHIRVIYPYLLLNTYHDKRYKFSAFYSDRYVTDPNYYKNRAFVTFQRSATKGQKEIISHFIKQFPRKTLIYEIDDNLLQVPDWNFASDFYNVNKKNIKDILRVMPNITVSTVPLKKVMERYCENVKVIPNHLPKFIWGEVKNNTKETERVRILYAGSYNHFSQTGIGGDFPEELVKFIMDTLDEYQWVFVGGIPQQIKGNPKIEHYEWKTIHELPAFLKSLNVDISLAPLENNPFNECKSNIKALESVALGVPLVSSRLSITGPYNNLIGSCETDEYFIETINLLARNTDKRSEYWQKQYEVLKEQLFWEENDNLLKYVDTYLNFMGKCL